MRLVCPNCSAQYEIDGSMIPEDGRDVQCSNCGHTWFELPGPRGTDATFEDAEDTVAAAATDEQDDFGTSSYDDTDDDDFDIPAPSEETPRHATRPENLSREDFLDDDETGFGDDTDAESDPEPEDEIEPAQDVEDVVRSVTAAATSADSDEGAAEDTDGSAADEPDGSAADDPAEDVDDAEASENTPVAAAAAPRRPADAAALDILREEAERELSQRRAPPSESLETQGDLGLETIRNRRTPSRALRARMAHMGETPPDVEADDEPVSTAQDTNKSRLVSYPDTDDAYEEPRRDLLPDIEEINSTLKTAPAGHPDPEASKRSGFRIGFLLVLFVVGAAIFAYAQAPAIARALPDAEGAMITYVDQVNGLRDWVDGLLAGTAQ